MGLGGYGSLGGYGLGGYGTGLQIVQQVPVLPVATGALALNYGGIGGYGGLGQTGYGGLGAGGLGVGGLGGLGVGGLGYGGLGVGGLGVGGLGVGGLGGLYRREGRDLEDLLKDEVSTQAAFDPLLIIMLVFASPLA